MDGISLGPILLRWNGLLIMAGVACGGMLAAHRAKNRGYDSEVILDLILPLMLWGTVGARLWHVFTPPLSSIQLGLTTHHYLTHPLDLFAIWIGGLGFPGALIGGLIAMYFFARSYAFNFAELLDLLAPGFAVVQAVGRLGNYFNQELYGLPAGAAWKIFIAPEHRLAGYESVAYYHPLFAYESILSALNLTLLLWVSRRFHEKARAGDLFLLYLFNTAMIRFLLEFLRLDVARVAGVNVNQACMGVIVIIVGTYFFVRYRAAMKL